MAAATVVERLGLGTHEMVALVGGGGKTTLLFALGAELSGRVVLTTTTKMSADRTDGHEALVAPTDAELAAALDGDRVVLAWQDEAGHKAIGVAPETADRWFDLADHVVIEADGSRRRPFKAPAGHEPVVPSRTTTLVVVMGAGALDRVIEDQCHRPMRVAAVAGASPYDRLTPERAARVLTSPEGGLKHLPQSARAVLVITGAEGSQRAAAERVADLCADAFADVVLS